RARSSRSRPGRGTPTPDTGSGAGYRTRSATEGGRIDPARTPGSPGRWCGRRGPGGGGRCGLRGADTAGEFLLGEGRAAEHGPAAGPASLEETIQVRSGLGGRPAEELGHDVGGRRRAVEPVARAGGEVHVAVQILERAAAFDADGVPDLGARHGLGPADRREVARIGAAERVVQAGPEPAPDALECGGRERDLAGERAEIRFRAGAGERAGPGRTAD